MRYLDSESPLSLLEPHHRPLVWAGGAAFFGFPLLQQALLGSSRNASLLWVAPAIVLAAIGVTLLLRELWRPAALITLALALGWLVAGSAGLRLQHDSVLSRPLIPGTTGGLIEGTAAADSREGRGSEVIFPVRLERYTPFGESGAVLGSDTSAAFATARLTEPAAGVLEVRIRGGTDVVRGSGLSFRLDREAIAAIGAGRRSVSLERSETIITPPTLPGAKLRERLRRGLTASLRRMGEPGALGRALLLGDRSAVSPGLLELVRRAGAMHLLALSGMHLALLAGILGVLLFPLLGRFAGPVAASLLAFYFWIVGPIPSLLRALLMFGLGALVKVAGRRIDPKSLLAAALLIALLAVPELATSLGWRLSTLALIGILWIGAPLWARGPALPPKWLSSLLWVSLGAFVATTPLSLRVFGEAYPASILSSLFLTPLVLLFIWVALLSIPLLTLLPGLALPLGTAGRVLYTLFEGGASRVAQIQPLSGPTGALLWTVLFSAVLLALLAPWMRFFLWSRRPLPAKTHAGGDRESPDG